MRGKSKMAMATVIDPSMMKSHSQAGLPAAPSILAVTAVECVNKSVHSKNETAWAYTR